MGLIKKIFGAVLGFLGGLVGGLFGKKDGFYMQLDEGSAPDSTPSPAMSAAPVATAPNVFSASEPAAAAATNGSANGSTAKATEPSMPEADGALATADAVAASPEAAADGKSAGKGKESKKSANSKDAKAATTANGSAPAEVDPVDLIRAAITTKQPAEAAGESSASGVTNFATDYLVNPRINRSPRRRPGPSISPFKDMAKQVRRSAMG